MNDKPRLLVLSHVLPFPRSTGQQQRVFYTLQAAREAFHVTFATPVRVGDVEKVREELSTVCDESILLPSRYSRSKAEKALHRTAGTFYAFGTGLKLSNYVIGRLEFSPARVAFHLTPNSFDCVLFEYWHAASSVAVFREKGIPCVLDMHDILWQSYTQQLNAKSGLPGWWKRWAVSKYQAREECAWKQFDGVIAINREEMRYVEPRVPETTAVFYAPMGTDLTLWPYSWEPSQVIRVAYYGGFSTYHNQQAALKCLKHIMPRIWHRFPEAELWLVGSNPPESIRALSVDPRVKVTGYVENVQQILRTMSAVICPWTGTYGFRSRLVEVMALGVPLVTSPDAVWGMELEDGKGLLLGKDENELATQALRLLDDSHFANEQSLLARQQVERVFSIDNTYGRLARELNDWLLTQKGSTV
jgi:glycosyltransferase involved in cell wall biosynthesis